MNNVWSLIFVDTVCTTHQVVRGFLYNYRGTFLCQPVPRLAFEWTLRTPKIPMLANGNRTGSRLGMMVVLVVVYVTRLLS
jgi:hypothetical protein